MEDRQQFVIADSEKYDLQALEGQFQSVLQQLHEKGLGVNCACTDVKMAIHKRRRYFVYKTPNSGHLHAVDCPSHSEQAEGDDDSDLVRLGFRLSRYVKTTTEELDEKRVKAAGAGTGSVGAKLLSMEDVLLRYYKESGLAFMKAEWHNHRGYGILESKLRSAVAKTPGAWAEKLSEQVLIIPRFDKAVSDQFERELDKLLARDGVKAKMCFVIGRVKSVLDNLNNAFRLEQFRGVFVCKSGVVLPREGDLVMLALDGGSDGKYSVDLFASMKLTGDWLVACGQNTVNLFDYLYLAGASFTVNVDHVNDIHRPAVWVKSEGKVISIFVDGKLRDGNRYCFPEDIPKLDLVLRIA